MPIVLQGLKRFSNSLKKKQPMALTRWHYILFSTRSLSLQTNTIESGVKLTDLDSLLVYNLVPWNKAHIMFGSMTACYITEFPMAPITWLYQYWVYNLNQSRYLCKSATVPNTTTSSRDLLTFFRNKNGIESAFLRSRIHSPATDLCIYRISAL